VPGDPSVVADLAGYLAMVGNRDRGLELLEEAVRHDIRHAHVMAAIGESFEDLDDRDRAIEWVGKALEAGLEPTGSTADRRSTGCGQMSATRPCSRSTTTTEGALNSALLVHLNSTNCQIPSLCLDPSTPFTRREDPRVGVFHGCHVSHCDFAVAREG
jgi:hypothetical protein